jgi:hypothetical protein
MSKITRTGLTRPLAIIGIGVVATSAVWLPSVSAAPASPAAATKTFKVNYTEPCDIEYFGNESLAVVNSGTYPTSVTVGKTFDLTKFAGTFTVPASLADAAAALGITSLTVKTTALDFTAVNATPATTNFDATPVTTNVSVTEGQPIVVSYRPAGATLTAPLKAKKAGAVKFQADSPTSVTSTFTAYGAGGVPILSGGTIDCSAPSPEETLFSTTAKA